MNDKIKEYYFKDELPIHRKSYCAFIDVLGFTDKIKKSFADDQGDVLLQKFHKIISKRIEHFKEESKFSLQYFKSFTDNIILAYPQASHDLESEFGFIILALSEYQFEMSKEGFFIRGGLVIGDLFVDENSVYGPALLEAYEIESKKAVNPIILLSSDVKDLVLKHCGYYAVGNAPQNRNVLISNDGGFFINYLAECIIDSGEGEQISWQDLKKHKKQIENALIANKNNSQVFGKYAWLASYHNYFCKLVENYSGYSEKVRVDEKMSSLEFNQIYDLWPTIGLSQ